MIGKKCNCKLFIRQAGSGSSLTKAFFFFFFFKWVMKSNLDTYNVEILLPFLVTQSPLFSKNGN